MDNAEPSRLIPAEVPPQDSQREAKRRKVRRGTRSCWECKRRKVRCTFKSPEDAVCGNCRRRSAVCVTQELPELNSSRQEQMSDRIVRVEGLVHSLLKQFNVDVELPDEEATSTLAQVDQSTPGHGEFNVDKSQETRRLQTHDVLCTLQATNLPPSLVAPVATSSNKRGSYGHTEHIETTQGLIVAFPSFDDTEVICRVINTRKFYFHLLCVKSFASLERDGMTPMELPSSAAELMDPNVHPVLLARHMILIALVLQTEAFSEFNSLTEASHIIMNRLIEAASNLVVNNEELHGTMEILECLMYESVFHKGKGNIRRAWFLVRKAMLVAQLMGIHRQMTRPVKTINLDYDVDPAFVWFKIVYADRFLSLLLGLPQGSNDNSMASEAALAADAPIGRLERLQSMIASRIIERNAQGISDDDFAVTQELDVALLKVTKSMPAKFWLAPTFTGSEQDFWDSARMASQMYYFTLVTQIHLPYLLRFDSDGKYDYSKVSCVNASREILIRHMAYRQFNKVTSCQRLIDYGALMAATTLLLAHFDSQLHRKAYNVLAHQRLSDRAMMERVLETMRSLVNLTGDGVNEQTSQLIECLLHIEADAAEGHSYSAVTDQQTGNISDDGDNIQYEMEEGDLRVVRICIPYFGHIRIARSVTNSQISAPEACDTSCSEGFSARVLAPPRTDTGPLSSAATLELESFAVNPFQSFSSEPFISQEPQVGNIDVCFQQYERLGMAADVDRWTTQDNNMTFVDL